LSFLPSLSARKGSKAAGRAKRRSKGTNGDEARLDVRLWGLIAGIGALVVLLNASSLILEAARDGEPAPGLAPWITEISSYLVILVLFPALLWGVRRLPFSVEN
jgi:hypothetical protein